MCKIFAHKVHLIWMWNDGVSLVLFEEHLNVFTVLIVEDVYNLADFT